MHYLIKILISLALVSSLQAGARGCKIGIVDVSQGKQTKESKRLFELLVMDAQQVYVKNQNHPFAWTNDGSEVVTVSSAKAKGLFKPMIIVNKKNDLGKMIQNQNLWDGLIVFEYDHGAKKARLKLFDSDGSELALIKLPLEKNGAMKHSLFKHVRRGAMTALGLFVKFSP